MRKEQRRLTQAVCDSMKTIQISEKDNVAVALHPITKGEQVTAGRLAVEALEDIPQGHKIALCPIKNGENVVKYGFPIGHATEDVAAGMWLHTHNMKTNLEGVPPVIGSVLIIYIYRCHCVFSFNNKG